jgi:DNA (cytosine-5)-methyltransferase 1
LIEKMLPQVVLIENVQGFVSGRNNVVQKFKRSLRQINRSAGTKYRLSWAVVDAADFGVPQRRRRAILVARRDGRRFAFPAPTTAECPVTAWDALRHVRVKARAPKKPSHWGRLLPSIPEGLNYQWHTRKGGGALLFGYRTKFWSFLLKLAKGEPAWTISAQPGPYTGPFHWKNRPLAPSELLRLQSFPASWKVKGNRIDQIRQIGNATPPLLAETIGRAIAEQLLGLQFKGGLKLAIIKAVKTPGPERVRSLPTHYRTMIGAKADHPGTGRGPRPVSTEESEAKAA